MMQFQVSPPKRLQRSLEFSNEVENRSSPPSYLILGPHAKVPKIHFQEVKLGKSKKETLIVRNPTETCVNLKFIKKPCNDFAFSCDLDAIITIPATEQTSIEIIWTPTKEGHFFEVCQLVNSLNGIKLSVHLLGICAQPPPTFKSRGLVKRRPLVCPPQPQSFNLKPKLPLNAKTDQPAKSAPMPVPVTSWTKPDALKTPPRSSVLDFVDNASFPFTPEQPFRRETFIVEKENSESVIQAEGDRNLPLAFSSSDVNLNEFNNGTRENPIPMAESTRGDVTNIDIAPATPVKASLQFDDFAFPFTPEGDRRATFVVEKEENGSAQTSVTGTITIVEDEEAKIRNDIDEAMAELENLENLVLSWIP